MEHTVLGIGRSLIDKTCSLCFLTIEGLNNSGKLESDTDLL